MSLPPLALAAALLVSQPAPQAPATQPPAPQVPAPARPRPEPVQREQRPFELRSGDAAVVAKLLAQLFRGQAEVLAVPATVGNVVLVSAPAGVMPQVAAVVERLDRRPRTVAVEVLLVEVPAGKDGRLPSVGELQAAAGEGKATRVRRLMVLAAEGQPATVTTGGSQALTTAVAAAPRDRGPGGNPFSQRSVSYHAVGTTVKVTARVAGDGTVVLDLSVEDTQVRPAEGGGDGAAVGVETTTLSVQVSVPAGRPVLAQAVRADGKGGSTVSAMVVSAGVVEVPRDAPPK